MLKEFRDFIMTGNVIDFAVAVILAGAVGMVVNGFVQDIMMPVIGMALGGADFSDLQHVLNPDEVALGGEPVAIRYGKWINSIINLIIVGFVLFYLVKAYNKTKAPVEVPAPSGPSEIDLLTEIRDALNK